VQPLPPNLSGETFSHIFGTHTTALELFILKQNIMGPCWLEIKGAEISRKNVSNANFVTERSTRSPTFVDFQISWCKLEVVVNDPKNVCSLKEMDKLAPKEPPPLVVMSLSLRTVLNRQADKNEIVVVSGMVYQGRRDETAPRASFAPSSSFSSSSLLISVPGRCRKEQDQRLGVYNRLLQTRHTDVPRRFCGSATKP
jgi:DNA polymerase alpha subunit A